MSAGANPSLPGGVTWQMAMERAVAAIQSAEALASKKMSRSEFTQQYASVAQAWISYARELTMHARAGQ